ncbi:MAG: DUF4125 family protein [Actinobacteria bacterium]|nr:DUF4125 family protein [Actinomycetota bacterium]
MERREELITQIIELEWEMFRAVPAEERSAVCQEDEETFRIVRIAGFLTWSDATLASYLLDLKMAKSAGRNLMTEKYALMQGLINPPNPEHDNIINRIVRKECEWAEEFLRNNPGATLVRPIHASEDASGVVSSETYSRCELQTYSSRTLDYYYSDTLNMAARRENRVALAVRYMQAMSGDPPVDWRNLLSSSGGGMSAGAAACT